jgi:hypothetical protein
VIEDSCEKPSSNLKSAALLIQVIEGKPAVVIDKNVLCRVASAF